MSRSVLVGLPRLWWNQRWLLATFIGREVRGRYVGSLGGMAWVLIHPLILLGIYALLFQSIFRANFAELAGVPFVAFVALGLWPWFAFQEGVQRGSQAVRGNAALVRKVAFAHELLVFASVSASFFVHLLGFGLALGALAIYGVDISLPGLPAAALLLASLFCLTVALALVLAALQVFVPDVEQFLAPAFSILFYATPVLYPSSAVPEWLRRIMAFNPVMHFVEPIRSALVAVPSATGAATPWVWWLSPLLLVPALWFFRRLSPYFEDFV
jgi:ABC-type polysaccharide/polyol phosphate export permease